MMCKLYFGLQENATYCCSLLARVIKCSKGATCTTPTSDGLFSESSLHGADELCSWLGVAMPNLPSRNSSTYDSFKTHYKALCNVYTALPCLNTYNTMVPGTALPALPQIG